MKYDEFKSILDSLWKIKRSKISYSSSLELGTDHLDAIDEAIRSLEDSHKKMMRRYYSEGTIFAFGNS